jgi:surface carbohydrate biosynthesis protein
VNRKDRRKPRKLLGSLRFTSPKKAQVLIVDQVRSDEIERNLNLGDYSTLAVRGEWVHVPSMIHGAWLSFVRRRGTIQSCYIAAFCMRVNAKVVLTFNDNLPYFYFAKSVFPRPYYIAIQNGFRGKNDFLDKDIFEYARGAKLGADVVFVHTEAVGRRFEKAVQTRAIAAGSLNNNFWTPRPNRNPAHIGYVSLFVDPEEVIPQADGSVLFGRTLLDVEEGLLRIVVNWAVHHGFRLQILLREASPEERAFFNEALKGFDYDLVPRSTRESVYAACDRMVATVSTLSTLGLENLARGNPTAVFWPSADLFNQRGPRFGDPIDLSPKGPFWSDEISTAEVERVLTYVVPSGDSFFRNHQPIIDKIMKYDPGNSIVKEYLKSVLDRD